MKRIALEQWSERQQVAAIIVMACLVLFLLWFFALAPLFQRSRRLEREIETMRNQLAQKNYLLSEDVLLQRKLDESAYNRQLCEEWSNTVHRLGTYDRLKHISQVPVGHIDFKVALLELRERLRKTSRALNISLPPDLGMEETVRSHEDARKLILQLRAVEKVVEMTFDLKIDRIKDIAPLPPVPHTLPKDKDVYIEEYPVTIEFNGTLQNVYDLLQAILQQPHVFILQRLRIESPDPKQDVLNVKAVLSACLFFKQPQPAAPGAAGPQRSAPMGF